MCVCEAKKRDCNQSEQHNRSDGKIQTGGLKDADNFTFFLPPDILTARMSNQVKSHLCISASALYGVWYHSNLRKRPNLSAANEANEGERHSTSICLPFAFPAAYPLMCLFRADRR